MVEAYDTTIAQAAMRHSSIDLTMNIYTDPTLLDVAGAVEALRALSAEPAGRINGIRGVPV